MHLLIAIIRIFVTVYFDNITVYSDNLKNYIQHNIKILKIIKKKDWFLKLRNANSIKRKLNYLKKNFRIL